MLKLADLAKSKSVINALVSYVGDEQMEQLAATAALKDPSKRSWVEAELIELTHKRGFGALKGLVEGVTDKFGPTISTAFEKLIDLDDFLGGALAVVTQLQSDPARLLPHLSQAKKQELWDTLSRELGRGSAIGGGVPTGSPGTTTVVDLLRSRGG